VDLELEVDDVAAGGVERRVEERNYVLGGLHAAQCGRRAQQHSTASTWASLGNP
jgi:hypothetical protein